MSKVEECFEISIKILSMRDEGILCEEKELEFFDIFQRLSKEEMYDYRTMMTLYFGESFYNEFVDVKKETYRVEDDPRFEEYLRKEQEYEEYRFLKYQHNQLHP